MTITTKTAYPRIRTGDDYSFKEIIVDDSGNPIDISGYGIVFEIRKTISGSPILSVSTSGGEIVLTNPTGGEFEVSLANAVTNTLPLGTFKAAVDTISILSIKTTTSEGFVTIAPRISQA